MSENVSQRTSVLKSRWLPFVMSRDPTEGAEIGVRVRSKPAHFMCSGFITHHSNEDNPHESSCPCPCQHVLYRIVMYTSPSGLDSVGMLIPSFQRRSKSDMIGRKNRWTSSGFCSFGPGRMLVHMRFEVRYLHDRMRVGCCHVKETHRYSGGRLQIENEVGHDECDGAMLLRM